jgi:hypothetical protein
MVLTFWCARLISGVPVPARVAVRYIPQRPYHCKSNKENYCRAATKQGSSPRTPRRVAKLYRVLRFDAGKEVSVEAAEVGDKQLDLLSTIPRWALPRIDGFSKLEQYCDPGRARC